MFKIGPMYVTRTHKPNRRQVLSPLGIPVPPTSDYQFYINTILTRFNHSIQYPTNLFWQGFSIP